jgi:chaperonin GroEL (HSP60 family)
MTMMLAQVESQGSTDLDHIQIIKKAGGKLTDSYLDEGMSFAIVFRDSTADH